MTDTDETFGEGLEPAVVDYLTKSDIVRGMTSEEVRQFLPHLVSFEVGKGKVLVREGEPGQYLALLISGEIQVLKRRKDGAQMVLSTLGPGHVIGEMSVVDEGLRSATIRASKDSMIVALTRESYLRLAKESPRVALAVLTEVARELSGKLRRMVDYVADVRGL